MSRYFSFTPCEWMIYGSTPASYNHPKVTRPEQFYRIFEGQPPKIRTTVTGGWGWGPIAPERLPRVDIRLRFHCIDFRDGQEKVIDEYRVSYQTRDSSESWTGGTEPMTNWTRDKAALFYGFQYLEADISGNRTYETEAYFYLSIMLTTDNGDSSFCNKLLLRISPTNPTFVTGFPVKVTFAVLPKDYTSQWSEQSGWTITEDGINTLQSELGVSNGNSYFFPTPGYFTSGRPSILSYVIRESLTWSFQAGYSNISQPTVPPRATSLSISELYCNATVSEPFFTDDPVQPGTTPIKAVHLNELRTYSEQLCTLYGSDPPTWPSGDINQGTTSIRLFDEHAREIRTAMDSAHLAAGIGLIRWTEQLDDCHPSAAAIEELRDHIRNF